MPKLMLQKAALAGNTAGYCNLVKMRLQVTLVI